MSRLLPREEDIAEEAVNSLVVIQDLVCPTLSARVRQRAVLCQYLCRVLDHQQDDAAMPIGARLPCQVMM